MKKILSLIVGLAIGQLALAQSVLSIENEQISKKEFLNIYSKNNPNPDLSKDALDEYMELFIDYKLKVLEAQAQGLDTLPNFIRELKGYRKQLSKPYLTDTVYERTLVDQAFERMQQEIRAKHILIKVGQEALPPDTLEVYNKLVRLKKRAENGEDFSVLAQKYSEDPSAKNNGGDLGYFSGMQMVYPFEDAAFKANVGGITNPVRTRYGYHIIQVTDKRPTVGKVRASHILITTGENATPESKQNAKEKIDAIYERLVQGESFEDLATKFSNDPSSAKKGGDLGVFGTGKMVENFENEVYALDEGSFSKPFETPYGYHIVKLVERIESESYEEAKPEILKRLASDSRATMAKVSLVTKLKKEYNFTIDEKALDAVVKSVTDSIFKGTWKAPKGKWKKAIATWTENTITQQDFIDHLEKAQRATFERDRNDYVKRIWKVWSDKLIYDFENDRLEQKYPDFAALMKEYHDGILLFDLTNKEVWNKAAKDSAGLKAFYEANKGKYQWKERIACVVAKSEDGKSLNDVLRLLKKGKSVAYIDSITNVDDKLNVRIEEKLMERGDDPLTDAAVWKKGKFTKSASNSDNSLVYTTDVYPPQAKSLDEVRGLVISDYQNELMEKWVKQLREKYSYQINTDVLYSIK